jgi:DNA-binding response OmpR family regulator
MKLLLVEDNEILCRSLAQLFSHHGIDCDIVNDGETGLIMACHGYYDVIILDIVMPKKSGNEVLFDMRKKSIDTPVLILTARDSIDDKEQSFGFGADDYLTKPFLHKELLLRIMALARRPRELRNGSYIQVGNTRIEILGAEVEMNGKPVDASAKEARLLEFLFKHKDRYVSKELILNAVWGIDSLVQTSNVEVYIHMLRKAFPSELSGFKIETKQGFGYKLREVDNNV